MSDTFILENKITEVFCDKLIDYYKSNISESQKIEEYGKVSNQIILTKQDEIIYKDRDHALFVAFAPVSDPKYAISVVVEHGGSGSSSAAPIAKQVIKKVLERDALRSSYDYKKGKNI